MTSTLSRSLAKAATWRVIGISTLVIVAFLAGASPAQVGGITITYHLIMSVLYFVHERAWNKTLWGKIAPGDDDDDCVDSQ